MTDDPLDEFRNVKKGPACTVADALAALPDDQRDLLTDAYADADLVGSLILDVLNKRLAAAESDRPNVSSSASQRHRRKALGKPGNKCACPVGPNDG